jgi:hypothetical protein
MKKTNYLLIALLAIIMGAQSVSAKVYEVPPSSATSSSVPVISDYAMEQCVILYNDAKDLKREMTSMYVDRYSQTSVNTYNNKVNRHSQMINQFNRDCAGKQSESAYRAAQKLNQKGK